MIWGGAKMRTMLGKDLKFDDCGESWEISAVQGHLSVVSNGFLAGNTIQEIIEVYMGDLVGEVVYEKFGIEFPLLIKFIDSNQDLSIQVHPNDELAIKRHKAFGKTEMWYVIEADPGSTLFTGFNQQLSREQYIERFDEGSILSMLNEEKVSKGDVYFIPAGRVHALRSGILLLEIQQTSDITYRIYDWNRVDASGNPRELHNDLALDAIDYNHYDNYKVNYIAEKDTSSLLVKSDYFITSLLKLTNSVFRDYTLIDSFIILICVEGMGKIRYGAESIAFGLGETILIPADLKEIEILPDLPMNIIEVYVPTK